MIIVKSDLNGDLRRFSVEDSTSFEDFSLLLVQLYPTQQMYKIKYKDDEGDWLSITSTPELHEAIRITKLGSPSILRVSLDLGNSVPSVPSVPTTKNLESSHSRIQTIRIQGRTFMPTLEPKAPLGPIKVTNEEREPVVRPVEQSSSPSTPRDQEKEEVSVPEDSQLTPQDQEAREEKGETSAPKGSELPVKQRFGKVISNLSDDMARCTLESSTIVSVSQAQLGASTAAMCNNFADSVKEFYSQLILETRVDPNGAAALHTALDSLCEETASECDRLHKDLSEQVREQIMSVRSALNNQELNSTQGLEDLLQQSISDTHFLASSVLQKTREQSLSFLEVMNQLHNETVSSVLREAGAYDL
eukprot:TRINITY_DN2752_c0_g1_i1.p1 TRINITY_DN2752_c0_g1~~TRINITY_DN2752_c0_g1_i1.p1  ORF type:complete len:361 (+),score=75.76 TRINITY_DN2752_c0_g1_i1:58-1140(+)